jgi:uncharacterized protein YjbI with pentapeptide repeats
VAWVRGPRKLRPTPTGVRHAARVWVQHAYDLCVRLASHVWKMFTGLFSKHRHHEEEVYGTSPEELSQRYAAASGQLDSDNAAVRLAGVSAMARVADDWPEQRQQCIDVLCGYLRNAPRFDAGFGETDARNSIVAIISAHLRAQSAISWVKHDFDFTAAALFDADFADVTFAGARTSFARAIFSGGVTRFARATFSGEVTRFDGATFSGGVARFDGATFSGPYTIFAGARFSGWHTLFDGATFTGRCTLFDSASFSGWYTNFDLATFSGTYTSLDHATFSAQQTGFDGATFSGTVTRFDGATFSGKETRFDGATFSGKQTSFDGVTFSGARTADEVTMKSSFAGSTVSWGPLSPRRLRSPAPEPSRP